MGRRVDRAGEAQPRDGAAGRCWKGVGWGLKQVCADKGHHQPQREDGACLRGRGAWLGGTEKAGPWGSPGGGGCGSWKSPDGFSAEGPVGEAVWGIWWDDHPVMWTSAWAVRQAAAVRERRRHGGAAGGGSGWKGAADHHLVVCSEQAEVELLRGGCTDYGGPQLGKRDGGGAKHQCVWGVPMAATCH